MTKLAYHLIRIVLGIVFMVSAYLKLFPIEPFELFVFEQGLLNWEFSSVLTRGILAVEFFIGIMLIINIFPRIINLFNLGLLLAFTLFLIYLAVFKPEVSNCNCFGEQFELSPLSSIFKNVIMILATIFLLKYEYAFKFKYQKHLAIVLLIAGLAFPHVVSPADFVYYGSFHNSNRTIDLTALEISQDEEFDINSEDKRVVCFFSTGCQYCKLSARKLSVIDKNTDLDLPIYYVFYGDTASYAGFQKETLSNRYPHTFLDVQSFFALSGNTLPRIMLINKNIVEYEGGYRDISEQQILEFLKE